MKKIDHDLSAEAVLRVRVRQEREARGWTLGQMAAQLTGAGYPVSSPSLIHKTENGDRRIVVDELQAYCKAFRVSMPFLLTPAGDELQNEIDANRLVGGMMEMNRGSMRVQQAAEALALRTGDHSIVSDLALLDAISDRLQGDIDAFLRKWAPATMESVTDARIAELQAEADGLRKFGHEDHAAQIEAKIATMQSREAEGVEDK